MATSSGWSVDVAIHAEHCLSLAQGAKNRLSDSLFEF